jgi:hypothetical protein
MLDFCENQLIFSHNLIKGINGFLPVFSMYLLSKNIKNKIYRTIILSLVLYGCETLSLTLKEEHRLRVFENRVPMRIFWPKRDDITGEWRRLHNLMVCTYHQILFG